MTTNEWLDLFMGLTHNMFQQLMGFIKNDPNGSFLIGVVLFSCIRMTNMGGTDDRGQNK